MIYVIVAVRYLNNQETFTVEGAYIDKFEAKDECHKIATFYRGSVNRAFVNTINPEFYDPHSADYYDMYVDETTSLFTYTHDGTYILNED